ncbi:hypothetical protein [Streptomyces hygroscopicus]|uniref:hypothetical protein n=1 Tax=Streptomyces hygroscopicus TaxID=1912 RepID=UPI00223FC7C9|nr:hypothetical protein [Streptomyces hygroscopicus]
MSRLRELYLWGGDPAYERFPALHELFLVLDHAQTWAGEPKQPRDSPVNVVGEAAVLRATLWQYLREQADAGQLKAVGDGRAAGVPWQHFTGALCVTSKQGAYRKARRLKAEQVREPGERRTPKVAREHEDRAAAEQRAERALMFVHGLHILEEGAGQAAGDSDVLAAFERAGHHDDVLRAKRQLTGRDGDFKRNLAGNYDASSGCQPDPRSLVGDVSPRWRYAHALTVNLRCRFRELCVSLITLVYF